jgi:hypothetical protein
MSKRTSRIRTLAIAAATAAAALLTTVAPLSPTEAGRRFRSSFHAPSITVTPRT